MKLRRLAALAVRPRRRGLRRGAAPRPPGPSRAVGPDLLGHRHRLLRPERQRPARRERVVRVPGVEVVIGTGTGTSAPAPARRSSPASARERRPWRVRTESLPAYFQPLAAGHDPGAGTTEVRIPLTLPIGNNKPNVYLGLGDSITSGDGSSDRHGYALKLQNLLGPHFGRAEVHAIGRQGDSSAETARGHPQDPGLVRPGLHADPARDQRLAGPDLPEPGAVAPASRSTPCARSCEDVKDWDSLPVLATIIPGQPGEGARGPQRLVRRDERQDQGARAGAEGHARRPQRRLQGLPGTCPPSSPTTCTRTTPATR